jgi:hypothetical protein
MAPPTFVFGAGAAYFFRGTALPSLQEQLEDAEVETARAQHELAEALAQMRLLGEQRDTARQAEGVARSALKQVRAAWTNSHSYTSMADTEHTQESLDEKQTRIDELENEVAGLKKKQEQDTATIEAYQNEVTRSENNVKDRDSQLRAQREKLAATERQHADDRDEFEHIISDLKEQLTQSHTTTESLRRDVEHHKAAADHNLSIFNRAFADNQNIKDARDAAIQAKDELEAQKLDVELRYESLFQQWQEDQAVVEEHANCEAQIEAFETRHENMEADYERQNMAAADTDRTLVVKDARIAELEQQLQREKQRNMDDADAANAANIAAATSPEHDAPPMLSAHSRSLSDELLGDYDGYDYIDHIVDDQHEDLSLSAITENSTAPVTPASPDLAIHMSDSVGVEPKDAHVPRLTLSVSEVGSVTSIEAVAPEFSISISEIGNVAPEDAVAPKLSISVDETGSVAPTDAVAPELTISVNEIGSVAPVDAIAPRLTLSVNEVGSFAPKDAVAPTLSVSVNETGSVAPQDAVAPTLSVSVNETGSVVPQDAIAPRLTLSMNEVGSVTPIDAVIPELSIGVNEVGSFAPKDAVAPTLSVSVNEVGSVAPQNAVAPELSISVNEAGSITPEEIPAPKLAFIVNEVGSVTPQDPRVPSLALSVSDAIFDFPPVAPAAPVVTPTVTTSTQTQAVQLTSGVVDSVSIAVAPTSPALNMATGSIMVTHEEAPHEALPASNTTTPVMVTHEEVPFEAPSPRHMTTPIMVTHDEAPVEALPPPRTTTPIMVTHEEAPLQPLPPLQMTTPIMVTHNEAPMEAQTLKASITSNGKQITASPASSAAPTGQVSKLTKSSFFQVFHTLMTAVLAFFSLYFYTELEAWRTANGVGFHGNGGQYNSRSGAYGNGRLLFGYIPVAMDEGNSKWSEFVARMGSVAITSLEAWAGIQNIPSY